jgi:hypothetical protein
MRMMILRWILRGVFRFGAMVFIFASLAPESSAQPGSFISPDEQYVATLVQMGPRIKHYEVRDAKTRKTLYLTTNAKYPGNDVKAAVFSPDSTQIAAAYHYGPEEPRYPRGYTWIGIWDIKRREQVSCVEEPTWVLVDKRIFQKELGPCK